MSLSLGKHHVAQHTAPYELDFFPDGKLRGVNRLRTERSDEILARTLRHVLTIKSNKPLLAWVRYFARTEP
jgi:hypothetical protein